MVTEYIYLCIHQQMYFLCEKRLLYFYSFLLWLKLKATERRKNDKKSLTTQQKSTAWSDTCYWSICSHIYMAFWEGSLNGHPFLGSLLRMLLCIWDRANTKEVSGEWHPPKHLWKSYRFDTRGEENCSGLPDTSAMVSLRPTEDWKLCQCMWWS